MIDLHTHSTASDGSLSPTELVQMAIGEDLKYLSLTDHDTTDGLDEARKAAKDSSLHVINGIELSASADSRTVHIVGLGIDPENNTLQSLINDARQSRIERAKGIGVKLEKAGVKDAYLNTVSMAGTTVLGRAHFARMLVEQGIAKNFRKVFKRYMVRGKPGYVTAAWSSLEQAVDTIHAAGGVAVLAHPMRYGLSQRQLVAVVERFSAGGGDAVEIISGPTTQGEINRIRAIADPLGLAASVGSDYHGPDKPWATLGRMPALPDDCERVWQKHRLWP